MSLDLTRRPADLPSVNPQVVDGTCTETAARNPHLVSTIGATAGVLIGVSGVAWTALHTPDLVIYPIGVTLAASVAAAINALRHDLWQVSR